VPVGASSFHHCRQPLRTIPALVPVAAQDALQCVAMGDESDITGAITAMVRERLYHPLAASRPHLGETGRSFRSS
jgi:hypothetical protein